MTIILDISVDFANRERTTRLTGNGSVKQYTLQALRSVVLALALPWGLSLASAAHAESPAATRMVGQISIKGGTLDGDGTGLVEGSVIAPFEGKFGAQFDLTGGVAGNSRLLGVAGHLYWRDPRVGMVGGTLSHGRRFGKDDIKIFRAGIDGAYYFNRLTLGAGVAYRVGNVHHHRALFISAVAYPIDNLALRVGGGFISGDDDIVRFGIEWQSLPRTVQGLSLFADIVIEPGDKQYRSFIVGLRYYFGAGQKTLLRYHRENIRRSPLPTAFTNMLQSR